MIKKVIVLTIISFLTINTSFCEAIHSSCTKDRRLYAINIDWWKNFNDPYLMDYLYRTVENNHKLKYATLNAKEKNQAIKTQMSEEFPSFFLFGNYARIKTPQIDFNGVTFESTGTDVFSLPLLMSYEADIFLKNHDKTKSKKKEALAAEYEEKAEYITIATDTATTYLNIIKLDKLLEIENEIVKVRKKIFDLTTAKEKEGLATLYDVTNTDKAHTTSMISVNDLEKQRDLLLHKLALNIGESPTNAQCLKRSSYKDLKYTGLIPKCISSEIVIYRPDIMKAEAELQKAKIDIRIARKEFLPNVPVIGAVGYTALDLGKLFNWDSTLAMISAGFMQTIFSGGKKISNLKISKIKYEKMFEQYKQTDLQAIQEINDALTMIRFDSKKEDENRRKLNLEEKNYKLVNLKYKEGVSSYLELIQYKENLLTLERDVAESKIQKYVDYLSLYKSVGGKL